MRLPNCLEGRKNRTRDTIGTENPHALPGAEGQFRLGHGKPGKIDHALDHERIALKSDATCG
jgi:hypothetical protein